MPQYEATVSFNVRRFIKRTITAETNEQAVALALSQVEAIIHDETVCNYNSDGYAEAASLDPYLYVDTADGEELHSAPVTGIDE